MFVKCFYMIILSIIHIKSYSSNTYDNIPKDIIEKIPVLQELTYYPERQLFDDNKSIVIPNIYDNIFIDLINIFIATKIIFNTENLNEINDVLLIDCLEEILNKRSSDDILDLLNLADYLEVTTIIKAAVNVWTRKFSTQKSNFIKLNNNLKKLIIAKLSSSVMIRLIEVNNYTDNDRDNILNIALKTHYNINTAYDKQHLYKSLSDNYIVINEGYHGVHFKVYYTINMPQFDIMDTVVTQGQYVRKMGKNPSFFQDKKFSPDHYAMLAINDKNIEVLYDFPVENINWHEANEYAQVLSKDDPDYNYRLPTDEELDIVYRAESKEEYFNNQDISTLKDYIWCSENAEGQTHPVKSKLPNNIGCYSCAVMEWTKSWSKDNGGSRAVLIDLNHLYYYQSYFPIVRAYNFNRLPYHCQLNYRCMINPESRHNFLGFRLVREVKK